MYLRIRSSAAIDRYSCLKYITQAFFYDALNAHQRRLSLPAIVLQAVIANMYEISQWIIFYLLFYSIHQQK